MEKLDRTEKGIGFIERLLELVKKYTFFDFVKTITLLLIIAIVVGFITNPTYIFDKYDEWKDKQHQELLEKRLKNNEKLHLKAEQLLYRIGADRVLILELHNGLENSAGMPFSKCSATYEAINEGVKPVAEQYQNINLSLMPFATYLLEHGYWCGNVEDIKDIDRGLYYKMLSNETTHFAACVIEGIDKPLAFMFVSFKATDDNHKCDEVRENIRHIALESALLLELSQR